MAGKQRDRFRERERRRDNRNYRDYDRSQNPYSSDEDQEDYNDNYNDNYRNNYRRKNNDRDWHDRRSNHRERYRSRSRERDNQRDSQSDRYDYENNQSYSNERKKEEAIPNNTIMLRNLGLQINENEIMSKLAEYSLRPKEIRLMRKKETGESRGFAFVEFNNIEEATYWKAQSQGHIIFSDGQQATLHYSIPKEAFNSDRNQQQKTDWTCYKCGVVNFKRRDVCFKCSTTREESAANETGDEISPVPTNCLLLRNLNPYTTEERILTILGTLTNLPIKSIKIPKEGGISLCVCFVELYTTLEASQIYAQLSTLTSGFIIDDFPIKICYAKRNVPNSNGMNTTGLKNAATMALAAAQWSMKTETIDQPDNPQKIEKQSIQLQNSLLNQNNNHHVQVVIPLNAPVLTNGVDYGTVNINNQIYRKYPIPDASTYVMEETSGFYYDAITCLYYDPNSHYYYNGTTQKYMYWSSEHQTYIPVETQQTDKNQTKETANGSLANTANLSKETENGIKEEDKLKNDKVKMAKKIQKDMERWAKQLNQKTKDSNKQSSNTNQDDQIASSSQSNSYVPAISLSSGFSLKVPEKNVNVKPKLIEKNPLFETYNEVEKDLNNELSANEDEKSNSTQRLNLTDWNKLICLLCKRQFNSKEQLSKHQQASELHKTNLFKLTGFNFTQEQIADLSKNDGEFNFNYRDRAKERRLKYGQSDQPEVPSSLYKQKYMKFRKDLVDDYSTSKFETGEQSLQNSKGAKLLKQMGWSDGQGLGKTNQGRSSLIEVERRAAGVGLGIKTSHPSGESYKDAVKRTALERYKQLHELEMNQMKT